MQDASLHISTATLVLPKTRSDLRRSRVRDPTFLPTQPGARRHSCHLPLLVRSARSPFASNGMIQVSRASHSMWLAKSLDSSRQQRTVLNRQKRKHYTGLLSQCKLPAQSHIHITNPYSSFITRQDTSLVLTILKRVHEK
jgi:hypothetical protein